MPIHPDYVKVLQPSIEVGDLVETHDGQVGIIVDKRKPEGIFITIKNANNVYYTVLINDKEKKFIGYSLKKLNKKA
jgi:preprotein translocase subunit YajC